MINRSFYFNLLVLQLLIYSTCVHTKRIIAVEFLGSRSQAITYITFLEGLAARGHEVTLLSTLKNYSKSVREVYTTVFDAGSVSSSYNVSIYELRESRTDLNVYVDMFPTIEKLCREVYDKPEIRKILDEPFDLVILQPLFNECSCGFVHLLMTKNKAPLILYHPLSILESTVASIGGHYPPSFASTIFKTYGDEMTLWERFDNFMFEMICGIMVNLSYLPSVEKIYREELNDASLPGANQVLSEASLVLVNTHFTITRPRPDLPNVIDVAGIHTRPPKPLPQEFDDFISEGDDGFILFSFGTFHLGNRMPYDKLQIFVKVFAKLKQRVIWKYEDENMSGLSSNVKLSKWIPQQDLLGDPRIKMFITHCGVGGMIESMAHAVPLLGIPFYGDQPHNAAQAEKDGFLRLLQWYHLSEETLLEAINDVINNPQYSQKAKEISFIFNDQMESPLDRAIWWTEYVMRHNGAPKLKSGGRKLNFLQYHSLDVIGILLGILSLLIYVFIKIIKFLCSLIFSKKKSSMIPRKQKRQ